MYNEPIRALYRGEIIPRDSRSNLTEEYCQAQRDVDKMYDMLIATLEDKQRELLDELQETIHFADGFVEEAAFIDGFQLGMSLAVDGLKRHKRKYVKSHTVS